MARAPRGGQLIEDHGRAADLRHDPGPAAGRAPLVDLRDGTATGSTEGGWPVVRWAVPAVIAALGVVYLLTMLPGIGFSGDTIKFQYIGKVLGTSHEPGEPLYTLLNALWVRVIPVGTLAWRVNLLSMGLSLVALALLARILRHLAVPAAVTAVVIAALGLTPLYWTHATVAEVYPLVMTAILGVLLALVRWRETESERYLLVALAVYGLSVGVHTMVALLAPGIVWFVWRTDRRAFWRPRVVATAVLAASAGLAGYAYLAWRTADPTTPYVETAVTDLTSFVAAVRGAKFSGQMFGVSVGELWSDHLPTLGQVVWVHEMLLLPFIPIGAWRMRRSVVGQTLTWWVVAYLTFAVGYNVFDWDVFLLPAIVLAAVWTAVGITTAAGWVVRRATRLGTRDKLARPALALAVAAPLLIGASSYPNTNRHDDTTTQQVAAGKLAAVPDGAILFTRSYYWSQALWELRLGEGMRAGDDVVEVPYDVAPASVAAYVLERRSIWLHDERQRVTGQRPVYALRQEDAGALIEHGLVPQRVRVRLADGSVRAIYRMRPATAFDEALRHIRR